MERPAPSGRYAARHVRSIPNENGAGPNMPPQSVGPTSSTPRPGNFVMSAEQWSGWPTDHGWATPPMETMGDIGAGGGAWSGFGYGRQNGGGYLRRVSTVMACVDLNTRQLASFPAYAVKDRVPGPLPSWYATPEPSLYSDWTAFMKAVSNSYQLAGEVLLYALARYRSNGYPSRFVALDPTQCYVDDDGEWFIGADSGGVHLPRADVCHIPYQRLPGVKNRRGIGPLQWAWSNLVHAAELDDYASKIAKYGVWAVLKHPEDLSASQAADLQNQWMSARYQRPGAPAVLSGGITFEQLTMTPKDMALLDLMWFDLEMIAAAMGVPAVLVNLPQNNGLTYQSTLMLADWHWRATLRPAAGAIASGLSQWLLPAGTGIEFNPDRYVQPGLEERARAYATLHGIEDETGRALSIDEIRTFERWAPLTASTEDDINGLIGAEA
jgi:HK97 family phage portal protein